jgi:hypothetical protein
VLRVIADSNIYILAMNFGCAPDKLLDMAAMETLSLRFPTRLWTK